jgi:hypothetical protein
MLETISLIFGVASSLVTLVSHVKDTNKDKRNNAAQFLLYLGYTLEGAIQKFKAGEVPHGACEIMQRCAKEMPSVLQDLIPDDELYRLSDTLFHAHEIEQLYITVQQNPSSLIELEKAAAQFHIASKIIELK